jgi:hypothetical protein
MSSRHRPLHTCGASLLAIAHSAYEKAQAFNGPIGSTTRRVATFASPLLYALQYQWLAILSFADDYILVVENVMEKLFPPSTYVFDRIDYLVQIIATFPEKFDDALDRAPEILHQLGFDCALVQAVSWLNFLIATLTHWESGSAREKDIMVDVAHQPAETDSKTVDSGVVEDTYEEVLEKGTKENVEKKSKEEVEKMEKINEKTNADKSKNDPILELFESGWLMNPGRGDKWSSRRHSASDAAM